MYIIPLFYTKTKKIETFRLFGVYFSKVSRYNRAISKTRWVVERTFGGMVRWFRADVTRFKGRQKVHTQHVLEAIAYNLKRSPGLLCLNAKNK